MGIFAPKTKLPEVKPAPSTPTQADSSVQLAGTSTPGNFSTYISSGGQTGLRRKASGAKTSLIGGGA